MFGCVSLLIFDAVVLRKAVKLIIIARKVFFFYTEIFEVKLSALSRLWSL